MYFAVVSSEVLNVCRLGLQRGIGGVSERGLVRQPTNRLPKNLYTSD